MDTTPLPTTSRDIAQRVIRLVENVRSRDDLSPARIQQLTGIPVETAAGDATTYGFGGQLTDVWAYNLVSLPDGADQPPSRVLFSFDDESRSNADMTPICDPDFDAFAAALRAAGYVATPAYGPHERVLHWDFARDGVSVQVQVRGETDARADHACVSRLIINA